MPALPTKELVNRTSPEQLPTIRPYIFHGVDLAPGSTSGQMVGDCPFCGGSKKFSVEISTGRWRCWVCGEGNEKGGGNLTVFLRSLWKRSDEATNGHLKSLAEHRKLLDPTTLMRWEVCHSITTREFLVPGYGLDKKLNQLYRYVKQRDGSYTLYPTPTVHHYMHGLSVFDKKKPIIYVCEGPWDGMALWEVMRCARPADAKGKLTVTANESMSLISQANVVAIPGCNGWRDEWAPLFAGAQVVLLTDSDHPKLVCTKCHKAYSTVLHRFCPKCKQIGSNPVKPAGFEGAKRIANLLSKCGEPPEKIHYLPWGPNGYDPEQKSGYDVRDVLTVGATMEERVEILDQMLERIQPIPTDWISGRATTSKAGGVDVDCLECTDWKTLRDAFVRALKWNEGLEAGLTCILSAIVSTEPVGDSQLWFKLIGPPSCGKSTLCEAVSVSKKYVRALSTLTGFHSGWKTDRKGEEDHSLIPQIDKKTLIVKDGSTLQKAANKDIVLSEMRDLYDGSTANYYKHGVSRAYVGHRMTAIICGTAAIKELDTNELGARTLDCVVMEEIDEELEDDIMWRAANRTARNMSQMPDGTYASRHDEKLAKAFQLTGGYVQYLRENAQRLFGTVNIPENSLRMITRLGRFISYMRARPSIHQDETAERELGTRLTSQMTRLAMSMAVVLNKDEVDDDVMARVKKVALDTARGKTLQLAKKIYSEGAKGCEAGKLSVLIGETDDATRKLLRFLYKIGAVESFIIKVAGVTNTRARWRLTERFSRLWQSVMEG